MKISMRRIAAILTVAALSVSILTACNGNDSTSSSSKGSESMNSDNLSSIDSVIEGAGSEQTTGNSSFAESTSNGNNQPGTVTTSGSSSVGNKPNSSAINPPVNSSNTSKPNQPSNSDTAFYQEILDTETKWLASMQLDNGALPMTAVKNGNVTMNPYFADFAALGILEGNKSLYPVVKKYADWHFAHLNTAKTDYNGVDGTIYDYTLTVSNGKVTGEKININADNKKSYDSTDSYAATFLCVLWKYCQKSGDQAYIVSHAKEIKRIINAMYSTMDNDLTMAKPDYQVKYLMDNCEVYEGIIAAIHLYEDVLAPGGAGDSAMLSRLKADKTKITNAVENQMWNSKGYYEAGLFKDGSVAYPFSWGSFYPCATAQLFPIISGLTAPNSARAKLLYDNFNKYYSTGEKDHTWEKMDIPDTFYWCSMVHAGAIMGDQARVKTYMTQYKKIMRSHAYPLYNAEAGKACLAVAAMLEQLK